MKLYKQLLLIPLLLLLAMGVMAQGFGNFASAVFIQKNGSLGIYNVTGSGADIIGPGGPNYSGDLGTFAQGSGGLILKGAGGTYKIATGQVALRIKIASTTSTGGAAVGNFIDDVVIDYVECNNIAMKQAVILPANNTSAVIAAIGITPNPVLSSAKIDLKGYDDGNVTLSVMDASGRVLKSIEYSHTAGNKYNMDLSGLSQGLYLIKVEQNGKSATAKVMKN